MQEAVRIAIIEDDPIAQRAIGRAVQLAFPAARITSIANGAEGLLALRTGVFDCAFIDYRLPGKDGLAIVREARAAGVNTPLIMITAQGNEELAVEAMKAGATDYLAKSRMSADYIAQSLRYALRIREAELDAAQKAELLQTIFDHIPVMIDCFDGDGRLRMANREWERAFGWTVAEAQQRDIMADFYPDPEYRRWIHEFIQNAGSVWADCRVRTRDGRDLDTAWANVRLSDGGTVGIGQDVTEQRRAEQRLREAEERYRTLFEQSPFGVVLVNPADASLIEFNTAAHRQFGYSREEFAHLRIPDLELNDNPEEIAARIQRIIASGSDEFDTRLRTRDGGTRDVHVIARTLNIGGRLLINTINLDITESNRLKEQLLHSQKMEAIGRLAGGVAHDFNNLLAVISGYSEALARRLGEASPLHRHVSEIQKAADRGAALTRQLLAFSRNQIIRPQRIELAQLVSGTTDMLRRVISDDIEIIFNISGDVCPVIADPGQLDQVIVNLALNARDAMPQGGRMFIELSTAKLSDKSAALVGVRPGRYAKLTVADTGVGMDERTRERIFEPFFTTKEGGTGLGLSIAYGIIQQYGGNIAVRSDPGKGTQFDIFLPCGKAATSDESGTRG